MTKNSNLLRTAIAMMVLIPTLAQANNFQAPGNQNDYPIYRVDPNCQRN